MLLRVSFPQWRRLLFTVGILGLVAFAFLSTTQDIRDNLFQYYNHLDSARIEDVLQSSRKPQPGRTIFFHETTCNHPDSQRHVMNLTARQACAIESAALNNPHLQIFALFACPTFRPQSGKQKDLIAAIESYKNVKFRHLNVLTYALGTPIEDWLKEGDLFQSSFPMQHTADLLRLISLYRFGGIYLDMDVVVLRSLENVPLNYVGAHDNVTLGNAVISLEPTGKGHEIGELFLRDYQKNFDGKVYVQNGPALVTRVLRKICGNDLVKVMQAGRKGCQGFQVFNSSAFYPIQWPEWTHYTEPKYLEETITMTKDSYLIHLWNKASYNGLIKVGSKTALGKLAEINCPKTYAAAGEYF